jgi:DtxR family Mn-dependent transcriptional regulator
MNPEPKLSSQMEDYLETIYELCLEHGVARVKHIAARLDVTNASVVSALKNLKRLKLVQQEPYGYVRLTGDGERIAEGISHRHEVLAQFLERVLCLDPKTASRDACVIEHSVSPETVHRLRALAEFFEETPKKDLPWREQFRLFYQRRARRD